MLFIYLWEIWCDCINTAVMKNRCQVWCLKSSICTRPKENIKFRASNDMHQLLHPVPSGLFLAWMWNEKIQQPSMCDALLNELKTCFTCKAEETLCVNTNSQMFLHVLWSYVIKSLYRKLSAHYTQMLRSKCSRNAETHNSCFCIPTVGSHPGTFCHDSPAHSGSNSAPWLVPCAVLGVL